MTNFPRWVRRLGQAGAHAAGNFEFLISRAVLLQPARKESMQVFKAVLHSIGEISSTEEVAAKVNSVFEQPLQIMGWSFDVRGDRPHAMAVARKNPDALLTVVPAAHAAFRTVRRFPKTLEADTFRMKRCVADAIASGFLVKDMICASPAVYAAQLDRLAGDPTYLAAIEQLQRTRFNDHHTIDASVADLVGHLKAALQDRRVA